MNTRIDGRDESSHRKIKITKNFTKHALGSVLIEYGETKVLCTLMDKFGFLNAVVFF